MSGKAVRETLAALGVIASLVFVGWEIRQNTAATRGQTRQALADASRELTLAISTDSDLRRAWFFIVNPHLVEGRPHPDLTLADTLVAESSVFTHLRSLENVFLQVEEGVVDESVFDTYGFSQPTFQTPFFTGYWDRIRGVFDQRFVLRFEEQNGLR